MACSQQKYTIVVIFVAHAQLCGIIQHLNKLWNQFLYDMKKCNK